MGKQTSIGWLGCALVAAVLSGCGGGDHATSRPAPQRAAVPAAVHVVTQHQATAYVEGTGTVEARTETQIAARVMGYIQSVSVREGDRVTAGQTLVEIRAQEMQAAVAQARAAGQEARSALAEVESAIAAAASQAKLAEATFTRMRNLHERKSISDQEFDEATARNAAAQAALRMAMAKQGQVNEKIQQASAAQQAAEAQLSYLRVEAPFAGLVTARMAEPGSLAAPGMPLLRIEQAGAHRLVASFPESVLGAVKLGQSVPVVIDAIGLRAEGTIAEIAPTVDAATRTVALKVSLPTHAAMRSGLFGKVSVAAATRHTLQVPASAVRETGQLSSVFVLDGAVARSRMVKLGAESAGMRLVLSGLSAGDRIVSNPPSSLRDGDPVAVTQ